MSPSSRTIVNPLAASGGRPVLSGMTGGALVSVTGAAVGAEHPLSANGMRTSAAVTVRVERVRADMFPPELRLWTFCDEYGDGGRFAKVASGSATLNPC